MGYAGVWEGGRCAGVNEGLEVGPVTGDKYDKVVLGLSHDLCEKRLYVLSVVYPSTRTEVRVAPQCDTKVLRGVRSYR